EVRVRRRDVALLVLVHPGVDPAELDNQDADTERAGLHGQRLAERFQCVFARRVQAVEREHRLPGRRGHIHHRPAAPLRIPGTNAEIIRSGPATLVLNIASATPAGVSSTVAAALMAALFTS